MASKLEYGAATDVGLVRTNNEDTYLAEPEYGLWLIADGMGGHDAGEVASRIVKESVFQSVKDKIELSAAIHQSHNDVKIAASQNIGSPNMGTTIVALLVSGPSYQVAWVGDSRAYLWDPFSHELKQISKDHSYVQALVDSGAITPEEMHTHAQKNIITQSLGVASLDQVEVDTIEGTWNTGQKILLCSDGLSDLVTDDEIAHILRKNQNKTNQEIVDKLIELSLEKGGIDNVTIEIISAPEDLSSLQEGSESFFNKTTVSIMATALVASLIGLWFFFK